MKNLKIIQKIYDIAFIITKVLLVFSYIGAIGSISGIIWIAIGNNIPNGNEFISLFVSNSENLSLNQINCELLIDFFDGIIQVIIFSLVKSYFKNEKLVQTPFDFDSAKELKKVSIITMISSCVMSGVTAIMYGAFNGFDSIESYNDSDKISFLLLGVFLLFLSFVYSYGAEIIKKNNE